MNEKMNSRVKDITGCRFGRILVVSFAYTLNNQSHFNVKCDCGKMCIKKSHTLRAKNRKLQFCSHLCPLHVSHKASLRTDHGLHKHPLYGIWKGMIYRCQNKRCEQYHNYGGRGISVCERWVKSVAAFIEDMNHSWEKGLQIDRIDVNGNYEPSNCRWVSTRVNATNKRNSILTLDQILTAESNGVNSCAVNSRLRYGWSMEEAINIPIKFYKKKPKLK